MDRHELSGFLVQLMLALLSNSPGFLRNDWRHAFKLLT